MKMTTVRNFRQLRVYQLAFTSTQQIFETSKGFPNEEKFSLTDQIRRSSRSVCASLAEAWRKRRYSAAFVSKLSDADAEAAETRVWLDFAKGCRYSKTQKFEELDDVYDHIYAQLRKMMKEPDKWCSQSMAK